MVLEQFEMLDALGGLSFVARAQGSGHRVTIISKPHHAYVLFPFSLY